MTQIVTRSLPHERIQVAGIGNGTVRDVVIKLNDNIMSLKGDIAALQKAVVELQRR